LKLSPAFGRQSLTLFDGKDQKDTTKKIARLVADEAVLLPMYLAPNVYIIQPWVHWVHTTFTPMLEALRLQGQVASQSVILSAV
jgi:hypothetical protein